MNHGDMAWMLVCSAMVFLMTPGLAFFYAGMTKRKNTVNTIMCSALALGLASILWVLVGFSLSFSGSGGFIGNLNWFCMNFNDLKRRYLRIPEHSRFCDFPDDVRRHHSGPHYRSNR